MGAQQVQSAPWLLIDEGNPFIQTTHLHAFLSGTVKRQTFKLEWMRDQTRNLVAAATGRNRRRRGRLRRPSGRRGYWISLQSLKDERTAAVVKEVEDQKDVLRAAPFVVLDLRGNGGGSSLLAVRSPSPCSVPNSSMPP